MKWLPDAPETTPDVLVDVEAVPTVRGYSGAPSRVNAGYAALAATCTGGALIVRLDGSTKLYAGTTSALYEGSGSTWTDRSRAAGYTTGDVRWQFTAFGDTSLAICKSVQLQSATTGSFADVANAPKAACMDTVGGFVILGNCDDTSTGLSTGYGDQPHRWWCSQVFNAVGSWAPSVTTQATSGLLISSPGAITAVKRLGSQVAIYKKNAIHLGTYVGAPEVWNFQQVPGDAGTHSQEAVVSVGSAHYFIGTDDIYVYDGSRPQSIANGVREWFFSELNKKFAYRIIGLHDVQTATVWWWYPRGSSETPSAALIYNYKAGTWGHVTSSISAALQAVTSQITYDSLGSLYTNYDDLPVIAYDSPFWQASAQVLSVFDTTTLYTLTGASSSSSITTGLVGSQEQFSLCDRVRALYRVKPDSATLTPYGYEQPGYVVSTGSATTNDDRFDLLVASRWHQFKVDFSGAVEIESITPRMRAVSRE